MNRHICFIALMLLSISSAKANLLTNGSFEISSINPGAGYLPVYPGETSIVGWDVVSEDVHYMGTFWEASDGIRSIDLDGLVGSAGGVSQTFSTVAGTQYKVTFDMAGNYANLPTLKPMSVSADGQSQEFTFDVTGRSALNMGWTPMSWLFVADDSSATLQFLSLTTTIQGWGPALDNVSVNPVPVPPAVWLFGSGVLGMIGIARRKKAA